MTKEEKELLLSVARILRNHLGDHHNNDFKYVFDDHTSLIEALKPFESNIISLKPDGAKNDQ